MPDSDVKCILQLTLQEFTYYDIVSPTADAGMNSSASSALDLYAFHLRQTGSQIWPRYKRRLCRPIDNQLENKLTKTNKCVEQNKKTTRIRSSVYRPGASYKLSATSCRVPIYTVVYTCTTTNYNTIGLK